MRGLKIFVVVAVMAVGLWGLLSLNNSSDGSSDDSGEATTFASESGGNPVDVRAKLDSDSEDTMVMSDSAKNLEVADVESASSAESDDLETASAVVPAGAPSAPSAPSAPGQVAMQMDPPLREIGKAWLSEDGRKDFTMPLPNGQELEIAVERFVVIGDDGGEFVGSVKGYPDSRVKLSYRGRGEAGTIQLPSENRMYTILPGPKGSVIFQERENSDGAAAGMTPPISVSDIPPAPNFIPPPPPELPDFLK